MFHTYTPVHGTHYIRFYLKYIPLFSTQPICLQRLQTLRSGNMKIAGSKPTFPLISKSTVWTTSSGVCLGGSQPDILCFYTPKCSFIFLHCFFFFIVFCRYLESCTGPALKRKSESRSLASSSSSTSEDDKPAVAATDTVQANTDGTNMIMRLFKYRGFGVFSGHFHNQTCSF